MWAAGLGNGFKQADGSCSARDGLLLTRGLERRLLRLARACQFPFALAELRQASRYTDHSTGLQWSRSGFSRDLSSQQLAFVVCELGASRRETVLLQHVRHEVARVVGAQRARVRRRHGVANAAKELLQRVRVPVIHETLAGERGGAAAAEVAPVAAAALSFVDQLAAPGLCSRIYAAPDSPGVLRASIHRRPWRSEADEYERASRDLMSNAGVREKAGHAPQAHVRLLSATRTSAGTRSALFSSTPRS